MLDFLLAPAICFPSIKRTSHVGEFKKHFLFFALLFFYCVTVWVCGLHLHLFTSRFRPGIGMDLFAVSAWVTCYSQGPRISSGIDPYPFRSAAIFFGVLGMILALGAKLLTELPGLPH